MKNILWWIYDWFDQYPHIYIAIAICIFLMLMFGWYILFFFLLLLAWGISSPDDFSHWISSVRTNLRQHVERRNRSRHQS